MSAKPNPTQQPAPKKLRPERKPKDNFNDIRKSIGAALRAKFPQGSHVTFSSKTTTVNADKLPDGALQTIFTVKAKAKNGTNDVAFKIVVKQHDAKNLSVMIRPAKALLLDKPHKARDTAARKRLERHGLSMIKNFNIRPFVGSKWRANLDMAQVNAYSANIAKYIRKASPKPQTI